MKSAIRKKQNIIKRCLDLYGNALNVGDDTYYSNKELQFLLNKELCGVSTRGMPSRTRSKFVKEAVCRALGYSVPKSFKKTQPRFLSQNFDTYIQKSNNLQIWNEEVLPERRYVLILVNSRDIIFSVKVLIGEDLKLLDKTGTLTHKYQARLKSLTKVPEMFSKKDSDVITPLLSAVALSNLNGSPSDIPSSGTLLSLNVIAEKLKPIINKKFKNISINQDRNRGTIVHKEVCRLLGYTTFSDNGQFPDILGQLIEVKLQTSPTIDLGLVLPESTEVFLEVAGVKVRHCDVRYLIFEAELTRKEILVKNFALGAGTDFFKKFVQFQGKIKNSKVQIPLPKNFFEE